ncbi:MAG: hypothetical protein DWQ07_19865 [Chloroflexi bacterium]|nr:MAG: hypothetical protein DWQ07_19865 [Chloroflexota bacterium]MBL1194341.1 hypothetical protein [Chloroflexota bacterium]NOH11631.1 hypothetical protein [Chloroflexota bacterium]
MRLNLRGSFATIVAILTGAVVLLGYFLPIDPIPSLRTSFLTAGIFLAAVALWMGIINLVSVHIDKMQEGRINSINSGALILFLVISLVITLIQGPTGEVSQFFFNYVQIPIETSIMAMLTFSLAYAIVRLLQRRLTAFSALFVISVWFTLLGSGPIFGLQVPVPIIGNLIKPLLTEVLAVSGARGILIGVGLGTVATGLRILIGADRPFGG